MSTKQHFILIAFIGIFISTGTFAQEKEAKIVIKNKIESADTTDLDLKVAGKDPLVVIDGVIKSREYLSENLSADQIESVNVLKGPKANEKYGEKGKHGVIEVITKNGIPSGASNDAAIQIKASNDDDVVKEMKILFLVDGKVVTQSATEQINTDNIERVDVVKDPKKIAKFAKDGVEYDGMVKIVMKK